MENEVTLKVNGRTVATPAVEGELLIHVLRERLGLTGVRYGCGAEMCGSCMVLIDGQPAFSCTRDVRSVGLANVVTIEGIGSPDKLHPVQQAFLDHQAGQCGYCLSGIIISAVALLSSNDSPSREQIVAALDRHLCRCGAHLRIIAAVETAATRMRERQN